MDKTPTETKKQVLKKRSKESFQHHTGTIMRNEIPLETEEQQSLFEWAETQSKIYPELALMFAIPNGGKRH